MDYSSYEKLIQVLDLKFKAMFPALVKVKKKDFLQLWSENSVSAVTELLYRKRLPRTEVERCNSVNFGRDVPSASTYLLLVPFDCYLVDVKDRSKNLIWNATRLLAQRRGLARSQLWLAHFDEKTDNIIHTKIL